MCYYSAPTNSTKIPTFNNRASKIFMPHTPKLPRLFASSLAMCSIIKELRKRIELLKDCISQMKSDKGQLLADICTIAKSGALAFLQLFRKRHLDVVIQLTKRNMNMSCLRSGTNIDLVIISHKVCKG